MDNDAIQLVIARLNTMPSNVKVNLGDAGTLGKLDLIDHVKKKDELGKKIVDMQLKYLRALRDF